MTYIRRKFLLCSNFAGVSIMVSQLWGPSKPPSLNIKVIFFRMIQRGPQFQPHDTERREAGEKAKQYCTKGFKSVPYSTYTQKNHFEILLNQAEIRLYLQFSD